MPSHDWSMPPQPLVHSNTIPPRIVSTPESVSSQPLTEISQTLHCLWRAAGETGSVYVLRQDGEFEAWGDSRFLDYAAISSLRLDRSLAFHSNQNDPFPGSDSDLDRHGNQANQEQWGPRTSRWTAPICDDQGALHGEVGLLTPPSFTPFPLQAIVELAAQAISQIWQRSVATQKLANIAGPDPTSPTPVSPVQLQVPGLPGPLTAQIDQGNALAFVKDEAGRYVYVNQPFKEAFPEVTDSWIGKTDAELLPGADVETIRQRDLHVLSHGGMHQFEGRNRSPSGTRYFRTFKWLLLGADGSRFVAGTAGEVTKDYRILCERNQALATLAGFFTASPLGIAVLDLDLRCRTVNQAFAQLLKIDRESTVGQLILDLLPISHQAIKCLSQETQVTRKTQRARFFISAESPNFCEWELFCFPILDSSQNVSALGIIIEDVTERGLNERRLERQAHRDQLLAETAELMLRSENSTSLLCHLFDRLSIQFELDLFVSYSYDERDQILRLVTSQGISRTSRAHWSQITRDQGVCQTILKTLRSASASLDEQDPTEASYWLMEPGVRFVIALPLVVGNKLLGTLHFGSRRRQSLPDEDRRLLECLADLVAATFQRLQLIERLREADRGKANLLATLAHELRNPLSPLRTGLDLLLNSTDSSASRSTLDIMRHQVDHIVQLVDDLLDMSRISTGKLSLRLSRIDLRTVVQRAVEALRPEFTTSRQVLQLSLPDHPIWILGDHTRLLQTLTNLLHNANKFTPDRGTIDLTLRLFKQQAIITIRDNGVGIARELTPYIFEAFAHGDSLLSRTDGGLGIGLAIVKGIVEGHSGTVEVASAGLGQGSQFTVKLPCFTEMPEQEAPDEVRPVMLNSRSRKSKHRILVVDDNRPAATTIAELLKFLGHDVYVAFEGREGLRAVERFQPDVVLLDIGMPNMNGYEVARQIRRQTLGRGIRLIALTGWGQAEDRAKAMAAGFDHHLTKPVKAETLIEMLESTAPETSQE